jgi:hypothetical protein
MQLVRDRLARRPDERFTIAGCGVPGEQAVRRELGADPRVVVRPHFDRAQIGGLLAEHDRGLSTSRAEGWGLNVQEMLEAGMTVHATPEGAFIDLAPFFPETLRPFPPAPAP